VRERYAVLSGGTTFLIDRNGLARIACEYVYSGPELDSREAGIRFVLHPSCDQLAWKRWSEWDVFPDDSICRTEGRAQALRTGKRGLDPEGVRPAWPWSQDQTELGTADFRSVKYHCYEASLTATNGPGLRARAAADRHVRACLGDDSVLMHVLTRCPLGQEVIHPGDRLAAECTVELIGCYRQTSPVGGRRRASSIPPCGPIGSWSETDTSSIAASPKPVKAKVSDTPPSVGAAR
jgi:hypothetical protein